MFHREQVRLLEKLAQNKREAQQNTRDSAQRAHRSGFLGGGEVGVFFFEPGGVAFSGCLGPCFGSGLGRAGPRRHGHEQLLREEACLVSQGGLMFGGDRCPELLQLNHMSGIGERQC